jgi:hypothetical protein
MYRPKYQRLLCELKNLPPIVEENYETGLVEKGSTESLHTYSGFEEAEACPEDTESAGFLPTFEEFRRPDSASSNATANSIPSNGSDFEIAEDHLSVTAYDEDTDHALASQFERTFPNDSRRSDALAPSMSIDSAPDESGLELGQVPAHREISNSSNVIYFDQIHLTLNLEAGLLLPLALK